MRVSAIRELLYSRSNSDMEDIREGRHRANDHLAQLGSLNGNEVWFLGLDSKCGYCSELGATVQRLSGGRINIISLHDTVAREWISETLDPSKFKLQPVLFSIQPSKVRAWTGPQLVARIAQLLGPSQAWKLAKLVEVGDERNLSTPVDRFSRRQLIVGISGVAAAFAIATTSAPISALANDPGSCGVSAQTLDPYETYQVGAVNCRYCPTTDSDVAHHYSGGEYVTFKQATAEGEEINFNPFWFRTSGQVGCWVAGAVLP